MVTVRTQHFINLVNQANFPQSDVITEDNKRHFNEAMGVLDMYRGESKTLEQTLEMFLQTGSRPLAYAGAAYVLLQASFVHNNIYDKDGVKEGVLWLEKARAIVLDCYDIEIIQLKIYNIRNEPMKLRDTLDKLGQYPEAKTRFSFALQEMLYWRIWKNVPQQEKWLKEAMERAPTNKEKVYALHTFADSMLMNGQNEKAIETYKQVQQQTPDDAWLLHNMSIAYMNLHDIRNAEKYNAQALAIMDSGAVRQIQQEELKEFKQRIQSIREPERKDFRDRVSKHLLMFAFFGGGWLFFRDTLSQYVVGHRGANVAFMPADLAFLLLAIVGGIMSSVVIINYYRNRH